MNETLLVRSLNKPLKNRFIPLARIRKIRWEEAVLRSRLKREGEKPVIRHSTCHCGSVECLGIPMSMGSSK